METVLFVGGIFIYGFVGMVVGIAVYRMASPVEEERKREERDFCSGAAGIFWPLGMWVAIGMYIVHKLDSRDEKREERKREEEELLRKEGML